MGLVKRQMEHQQSMREAAIGIAIQAGVLKQCPIHEDIVFEGSGDVVGAYKLGNYKFSKGEFKDLFDDRKEMTDCIKEVVEDHDGTECGCCAKMMEE